MTTPSPEQLQKQALEYVKQGQEAITSMFSAFAENVASMMPGGSSSGPGALGSLPRPAESVDQVFDPSASEEQVAEENAVQMEGSQQEAAASEGV